MRGGEANGGLFGWGSRPVGGGGAGGDLAVSGRWRRRDGNCDDGNASDGGDGGDVDDDGDGSGGDGDSNGAGDGDGDVDGDGDGDGGDGCVPSPATRRDRQPPGGR